MRRVDFQEAIHKYEPSAHLGTIIKILCDRYEITRTDFFVVLELHHKKEFTWEDFATAELTANWDKHRWYRLKNNDWITLYRAKDGKHRKYNLYKMTAKAKAAVRLYYDYCSGAKPLPEHSYKKGAKYSSNRIVDKVKQINDKKR